MLGRAFGAAAAFAVGINAFLLPPHISDISSGSVTAFPVKLPCPDCVFSAQAKAAGGKDEGDDLVWVQGGARAVVLNFTVSDDMKKININDWQLYPPTMDQEHEASIAEVSAVTPIEEVASQSEQVSTLVVSGASIFINTELVSPAGDEILNIHYQIMSLEEQPVSVGAAEVQVLKAADGNLMIISANGAADHNPFPPPPSPDHADKECNMLPAAICKWKSMIESKIGGFKQGPPPKFGGKGCGGRKGPQKLPGHIRPPFEHFEKPGNEERPKHHFGRPPHPHAGPGMHGGPHHHHRPHHHFLSRFLSAFVSVLVPVIAGITMGMLVSVVGMATGRLIGFLWIKFRRGGQRGYASVAQTDAETESSVEKGAVIEAIEEEQEEPLPAYEAAPGYEEKEQK